MGAEQAPLVLDAPIGDFVRWEWLHLGAKSPAPRLCSSGMRCWGEVRRLAVVRLGGCGVGVLFGFHRTLWGATLDLSAECANLTPRDAINAASAKTYKYHLSSSRAL